MANPIHPSVRSWSKRLLDGSTAVILLLVLSPVLLLTCVVIGLKLGHPILFRQQRPGLNAQPFTMIKFRTMRNATALDGSLLPDAQRLTRLGRFLRATSIDELPELWNVLCGHMSLVGPRPWLMEYLPHYTPEQMRRHEVRPGITGWAQVNGRNTASWEERLRLDQWYVEHWSLWLDLRILLRTIWTVIRRDGISAAGHATMPRLDEGRASPAGTDDRASSGTITAPSTGPHASTAPIPEDRQNIR